MMAQETKKMNPPDEASILFHARQLGDEVQLFLKMNPCLVGDIADVVVPGGSNLKNTP
jgi:hypothetical protein